jgi:hypothetical protein
VVVLSVFIDGPCSCIHLGGLGGCQNQQRVPGSWVSFRGSLAARQSSFVICDRVFRAVSRPSIHPSIVDPLINDLCAVDADLLPREKKSDQRTGERHCIDG